jgi:REP element-mobilizing transposase RayT
VPQSLARIYIHLVFSTKNRERFLPDDIRDDLHAYMGGILRGLDCPAIEINTEPDHVHVLFVLARTATVSNVVQHLKTGSTDWLKKQRSAFRNFHWQGGYGAFSVSKSNVEEVRDYIRRQAEHHRGRTYQDEFRALLLRHEVEFDERYVWD